MEVLPHTGVYTRLKPSRIHGVGVFAITDIPRGSYVFHKDDEKMVWIEKGFIENLPKEVRKLYDDFCVIRNDIYGCPESFDKLTPSWYLNHSDNPNVYADEDYRFIAMRDIKAGEELTVNYNTYSERS